MTTKVRIIIGLSVFIFTGKFLAPNPVWAHHHQDSDIHNWMEKKVTSEMRYLFDGGKYVKGLTGPSQLLTINGKPVEVSNEYIYRDPVRGKIKRITTVPKYSLELNKEALYKKYVHEVEPVANHFKNIWGDGSHWTNHIRTGWTKYFAAGSGIAVLAGAGAGLAAGFATGSALWGLIGAGAPLVLFFGVIPAIAALVGVARGNAEKSRAREIFDAQPDSLEHLDSSQESIKEILLFQF